MRKTVLFLSLSLTIVFAHAQYSTRDSLRQLLRNEKTDTGRVLRLSELSFEYIESKPDTMLFMAMEAYELSQKIHFPRGVAISLNRIGNAYNGLGNYPAGIKAYFQALQINEKIHNLDGYQRNLNNIGSMYYSTADYRIALDYLFRAKELSEKIMDKKSFSIALVNIGECYLGLKMYDSAKLYVQQSFNVAASIGYTRLMGASYTYMGDICIETKEYGLAFEYYRSSISYSTNAINIERLSDAFLGVAKVFEQRAQDDSVLFYAKRAMMVTKEKGFLSQHLNASSFLSAFYQKRRNADSALVYLQIARAANDSLFSRQKLKQMQSLSFDEKIRQQEIAATELKEKEERKHNLQYAAIAIALITFIILFLVLSRSIIVKEKFIEFFGVLGLLAAFEFINLFIHPYLAHATNDSPVLMLVVLIAIGALLVPLHHRMERWMTNVMVEKNKKIRLIAAKKTIASLEGK